MTNNAIQGIRIVVGEIIDIVRTVIYPEDTGGFTPTRIMGVGRDASTGRTVVQALIEVECTEGICGILDATSDSKGSFVIAVWANLASVVTVEKAGYRATKIEVIGIPTGSKQSVEIKLERISD